MAKVLREGASYTQRDILEFLGEFSAFKDRVEKKFNTLARELEGKTNEHDLWVNLYLVSTDYAEETVGKRYKQQEAAAIQKVS
ncbi:MAG: hypothetical protein A4E53_03548 [Pelotomaculum sp. PtaB.Bin104]|nr:MAG: hypothetical protein A4E53_03548 [Pelotomaculum sp. PtaB.Bin104]